MRNAECGIRNAEWKLRLRLRIPVPHYVGICANHSPVIMSSNNTTLPPPSKITSTYRRTIGSRHHSSSMRQTSPIVSTARRIPHPASRIPIGCPFASSSTVTRWGAFRARSLSGPFRIFSGFIVDQRVAPLGEAGPWLHLDDVIQHRPSDPERDLPRGALERTSSPGAGRGGGAPGGGGGGVGRGRGGGGAAPGGEKKP